MAFFFLGTPAIWDSELSSPCGLSWRSRRCGASRADRALGISRSSSRYCGRGCLLSRASQPGSRLSQRASRARGSRPTSRTSRPSRTSRGALTSRGSRTSAGGCLRKDLERLWLCADTDRRPRDHERRRSSRLRDRLHEADRSPLLAPLPPAGGLERTPTRSSRQGRPPISTPSILLRASSASAISANSTKPNPRGLPVSRSFAICTPMTSPTSRKTSLISSSVES
mmetsp:Transcript_8214/g.20698  ORF Transcript_8214/g.20698 Transcript_8214/m.20698 type:complete len:226 (+) Transcript_8214:838-1515(+)